MITALARKMTPLLLIVPFLLGDLLRAETPMEEFFSTKLSTFKSNSKPSKGKSATLETKSFAKKGSWKSYHQSFGNETLLITLPDVPIFTRVNDTWSALVALKNKREYWVMAPFPAIPSAEKESLFPLLIERHSKTPYKMIDYQIGDVKGLPMLMITSLNKKTEKIEKTNVIITPKNFYVIQLKYPKNKERKVDSTKFLNAIHVMK